LHSHVLDAGLNDFLPLYWICLFDDFSFPMGFYLLLLSNSFNY